MRDYIGYLASVLVLCTFCARTMIPLRAIALASNVAFLAYGGLLHLYPVLLLHAVLMPVNVWRLAEIFRLRGHVRKSTGGDAVCTALCRLQPDLRSRKARWSSAKGNNPTVF